MCNEKGPVAKPQNKQHSQRFHSTEILETKQDTYISFAIKQGAGSLYCSFIWYRMGRVGNFFLGLKKRVGKYALQEGVSHFPGLGLHTA